MKIFAVAMIRNEIDVIDGFLSYHDPLLDGLIIADMQSSDGTTEAIDNYGTRQGKIERIVLPYMAKYQAEVLTTLSKIAFRKGADWVFFIDGDEFLYVENRQDLEHRLNAFGGELMHLPWINLIPSNFGTFSRFDFAQNFYWSGRLSNFSKIAISSNYTESYPDYVLTAGNHNVRPNLSEPEEKPRIGIPMLHLPVRSVERARYKAANALDLQRRKHNHILGEGHHHKLVVSALDGVTVSHQLLAGLAYDYGCKRVPEAIDPKQSGFPTMILPFSGGVPSERPVKAISPVDLRRIDRDKEWMPINLPKNATVFAQVDEGAIRLLPQPIYGDQTIGPKQIVRLPDVLKESGTAGNRFEDVVDGLRLSMMPPTVNVFSAWTNLVPTLGMLFSFLKPRRYVELGVHNGMSFLSACAFSNALGLGTECVAIDSWEGDPHAGFHDRSVFETFQSNLKEKYPDQIFIRSYFDEAAKLFDNGSIDLLHIDGFHSYEAVRHDFETWLGKLSSRGVVIFHDTNVHERDFGVWRFWAEVSRKYPHIELYHGHGLGILYVGDADNPVADLFRLALRNRDNLQLAIYFLEFQSDRAASSRKEATTAQTAQAKSSAELNRLKAEIIALKAEAASKLQEAGVAQTMLSAKLNGELDKRTAALNMVLNSKTWRRTRAFRRWSNSLRKRRGKAKKIWPEPFPSIGGHMDQD